MSVEITMEISNQNKLKRSYKFLKDSLKKIKVLEDNIYYTRIEKKHLKHKFIQEKVEFVKETAIHPSDKLKRNTEKISTDDDVKYIGPFPSHPRNRLKKIS